MSAPRPGTAARLLTNGAWNALSSAAAGAISFLVVPMLLGSLGDQAYGVWVLVGSLFAYSTILHFGLSSAINRHIPVALAKGLDDDVRRVVSTGTVFFAGVGTVIALVAMVLHVWFTTWFNVPAGLEGPASDAVLVVGLLLAATVVSQTFGAALSGYQRYDLSAISRVAMLVVRGFALWYLLRRGAGLVAVAWVFGLTELGVNLLQVTFGLRLMPARLLSLRLLDRALLVEMLAYGGNTFLYSAGAVIAYKAGELILGITGAAEEVARFSIAAVGVLTLSAVVESFSAALKPAVSDLDARDESDAIRSLSLRTQRFALLVILPSTAFLVLMGGDFIALWTGVRERDTAIAMALVAVGQALRLSQQSNFLVLVGKGEHRFFGVAVLAVGLLTIVGTIVAVGLLDLGVVGAAAASCVAWTVVAGFVIPAHVNARLGISSAERWRLVYFPALRGCSPAVAALALWTYLGPPASWLALATVVAVIAAVTGVGSWHLALQDDERRRVSGWLARRLAS